MTDFELVYNYQSIQEQLAAEGFKISPVKSAFFVINSRGTIVADCQTVDGLRGFLQGIQYAKDIDSE